MSTYSVADAKNQLSELIDRALRGEGVVITRHGRPMVELKPVDEPAQPLSAADLDWLAAHRVGRAPGSEDAGRLVERMRDESER
jgi:prevent-host-death family protein